MSEKAFFPQRPLSMPMIYAYEENNPIYRGLLKIGFTTINVEDRVKQQFPVIKPGDNKPYKLVFQESAMYPDGSNFMDHDLHKWLKKHHYEAVGGEWFRCTVDDVRKAWVAVSTRIENEEERTQTFKMRPEQQNAVDKTIQYFESVSHDNYGQPKFLWNCKMRFGKTFASYELAKKMGFKKILILTFKPAVESAWEDDLMQHADFEGWQFVCRDGMTYEQTDKTKPIVCFGSFQDFLQPDKATGGIKPKNEWVHTTHWDIVIFDEYHFGAWRDSAKSLFAETENDEIIDDDIKDRNDMLDETWLPITATYYLYLSGTPFRAINSGEFIEEQVYNWTYSDEQREKENWVGDNNPYEALPRIVMMTYKIPESIRKVAINTEYNEFDLNEFFNATGTDDDASFKHENEVQKWLDLIRGGFDISIDELKVGTKKRQSFLPYKETALLNVLNHTLWFLPNVASCYAMSNLLKQNQNKFYHDYQINVCSGSKAGIGVKALEPVKKSMSDPLNSKTITLTCGKLTTGVTVKPWTGIFMLRNLSTPETYFQSAFRVQSPWTITDEKGKNEIIKRECYIFDFALERALKQIADYATKLDINESNPEKKVADFINFLPVLAYQDGAMQEINAGQILDIAMSGTTASLLARRWESALLVNVDNATLQRLLASPEAMEALMRIEAFRSLNNDITTVITKSEDVKKKKKKMTEDGENPTPTEKKELTEEEKEYKSKRKEIQEKLIKFATRIPVFMYLSDYREYCLKDVITKLEPALFKKVTGLDAKDFNLLVSLGIFNEPLMNDAVYKFKRYEDSSLEYSGINKHSGENVGGFSSVISNEDYQILYGMQQSSLSGFKQEENIPTKRDESAIERKDTKEEVVNEIRIEYSSMSQPPLFKPIVKPEVSQDKTIKIDKTRIVVGEKVMHKAFGEGIISFVDKRILEVTFSNVEYGTKPFQNPAGFENGFLRFMND